MTDLSPSPETDFISSKEVAAMIGCSYQTFRRLIKTPAFPNPVRFGGGPRGTIRWKKVDVLNWIANSPRTK
jgi:predicted DNA-binding transcriptional regulator AlpA